VKPFLTVLFAALVAVFTAGGAVKSSTGPRFGSLNSGRMRPSVSADFSGSLSNFFATVRFDWGELRGPFTPAPRSESFREKRSGAIAEAMSKLAVISTGSHVGTGFVVRDGGRIWLYTNAHVVRDRPYVKATMLDGTDLMLGAREYAEGRDFARFALARNLPALELRNGLPVVGEKITVLGNSDGRGVITELHGRVLGVGPTEIEIDATFTSGNSGSPVLDSKGRVIAVASYLRNCRNDADWSKKNTRFNGIRRFALRLQGVHWSKP